MPQTLDTLAQGLNPLIKDTPIELSRTYGGLQLAINQGTDYSEQIQALPQRGPKGGLYEISYSARMPQVIETLLSSKYAINLIRSPLLLSMKPEVKSWQEQKTPDDVSPKLERKDVPFEAAQSALLSMLDIFKKKLAKN